MKCIFNRQDNTSCLQSEIIPETASYISTSDKYARRKISPIPALKHVMSKVNLFSLQLKANHEDEITSRFLSQGKFILNQCFFFFYAAFQEKKKKDMHYSKIRKKRKNGLAVGHANESRYSK